MIKLDIEGHPPQALQGMNELLSGQPYLVVFAGASPGGLFAFLRPPGRLAFDSLPQTRAFAGNDAPRDAGLVMFTRATPVGA